jgi:hypothetical protein
LPIDAIIGTFGSMSARIPLDVDLEDRLLYGLTPVHLAYAVVALLVGFALWSSQWAPSPVRAAASLSTIGVGAVVAWGRWRGRAVDAWVADAALFALRCHRIVLNESYLRRWKVVRATRSLGPESKAATPEAEPVAATS